MATLPLYPTIASLPSCLAYQPKQLKIQVTNQIVWLVCKGVQNSSKRSTLRLGKWNVESAARQEIGQRYESGRGYSKEGQEEKEQEKK